MKFKLKIIRKTVLSLAALLVAGGIGFWLGKNQALIRAKLGYQPSLTIDRSQPVEKDHIDLDLFWEVWDRLETYYFDDRAVDPQQMVWGAIQGMTAALKDPYTVFLPPKQNQRSKEDLNGAFEGVGIELGYIDNNLGVVAPLEGMPAKMAGIRSGDLILHIKDDSKNIDVDSLGMSLPEAVEIIRGKKGTPVILQVLHQGESEPVEIEIVRQTIIVPSIELKWLDDQVAYLRLTRFGDRTSNEWQQAVEEIVKDCQGSCPGLILDLRNNPGGYLESAVNLASEFINSGTVVKQENANGSVETYSVNRQGNLTTMPTVVLINRGSASSSEILAGSLRVRRGIKLVGEKSFGKGTIQEAQELEEGAGLHVTTAKWLLPDDSWVNDTEGLEPDVSVEDDLTTEADEQLVKALEVLK